MSWKHVDSRDKKLTLGVNTFFVKQNVVTQKFVLPVSDQSSNYNNYNNPVKGEIFYESSGNNLWVSEGTNESDWKQVTSTNNSD